MECVVVDIQSAKQMDLKQYIQYICETSFEGAAQSYFERFGVKPIKVYKKQGSKPGRYTFFIALPSGYVIPGNSV